MKKRVFAILLTLCLMLSLAACSSGGSSEQSSQPQGSSQTQEPSQSSEPSTVEESSVPTEEEPSSTPEETEVVSSEESGGEEETPEGAISEDVLSYYALTAEEFETLRTAVSAQIQAEWTADEAYTSNLNGLYSWIYSGGAIPNMNADENLMTDEAMDEYIEGVTKFFIEDDPLFQERAMVLAHALNRWAADNEVEYDKWLNVWSGLEGAFWKYGHETDPSDEIIMALFQSEN